jgi:WD40 repeat protein
MDNNHSPLGYGLVPEDKDRQLSLPSEMVGRGLELAVRIERQHSIEKCGKPLLKFPGLLNRSCVNFSKNGEFAAITTHGKQKDNPGLVIWNMVNGILSVLPEAGFQEFAPSQRFIEQALKDNPVISEVKISANLNRYETNDDPASNPRDINCVALSNTGAIALIGYANGCIGYCDVNDGIISDKRIISRDPRGQGVGSIAISPDNYLLAGSVDLAVHLWEVKSGRKIYRLEGYNPFYNQLSFSDDGSKLLIASISINNKPCLTLLDVNGRRPPLFFRNDRTKDISAVAISSNSNILATIGKGIITLWDIARGSEIIHWNHTTDEVNDIIKSYSWTERGEIPFSDEYTIEIRKNMDPPIVLRNPYIWGLSSIAISPDGNRILSGGGDNFMRIWTTDGDVLWEYPHESQVVKVAFHPKGHRIFAGCMNGSIYVWESP